MMYSSAATATADWRANGIDLERIAREGHLDIFVDQTWAGASGEAGVRAWTLRDGTVRLLAGNPEEGLRDDADRGRTLDLALPASWRRCVLPPHGSTLLSCPR